MTLGLGDEALILQLPDDALYAIFSYCTISSLGKLAQVCRRFCRLVNSESVWRRKLLSSLMSFKVSDFDSLHRTSTCLHGFRDPCAKELCRISQNWVKGKRRETRLFRYRIKQLPWLQSSYNRLWYSRGSVICCNEKQSNGSIKHQSSYVLEGHNDDVCHFVYSGSTIVSGGSDTNICIWNSDNGLKRLLIQQAHTSDVNCIATSDANIVSGSRDNSVKIWSLNNGEHCRTLFLGDRVWSISANPSGRSFATGTAGFNSVIPLQIWDFETGLLLCSLGKMYRRGAGILDIVYEDPYTLLCCGYDTCIRLWDMRTNACELTLEDPHDTVVYCIASDGRNGIVSGTARHALVRLWDKRIRHSIQMYYVSGCNSPVYSLVADPSCLYVALDQSISMLNFAIR